MAGHRRRRSVIAFKNSQQIVSSLLHMHANIARAAAEQFHNAAARVAAMAAVAVPMLAVTKIICNRVRMLAALGHFLEG